MRSCSCITAASVAVKQYGIVGENLSFIQSGEWTGKIHYWVTALLALAVIPLLIRFHLPTRFDWIGLAIAYWLSLATKALFMATFFALIGFSPARTVAPLLERLRREKIRILLLVVYVAVLVWALPVSVAVVLSVDTVVLLELYQRIKLQGLLRTARAVLPPALYLFCGLLLVSAYNDIVLSVRFFAAYDAALNSIDKFLFFGFSVSDLCHWAVRKFSLRFFHFVEFIYYGMFAQIGATMFLTSFYFGRKRALQFVGAVLTAYYLALVLFYLWPSQGPYYLCPQHFSQFPASLKTYAYERGSIAGAQALWSRAHLSRISFDYYIAFPCMHIVQPLVVMWFLRPWKRITIFMAVYNVLLVPAIMLLEWHYFVDIVAGIILAGVAIVAVDGSELWRWRIKHES